MRMTGALLVLFLSISAVHAQPQTTTKTVLDGVYSDAQVARGKTSYAAICSRCHGESLEGVSAPALTDNRFIERWREGTLEAIYNFVRQNMPPGRQANSSPAPDSSYLDIVTYILSVNGYRSGANELTPALAATVMFVGKNGPQPVPDGSLVITIGCLSQAGDNVWTLSRATEPIRTRTSTNSNATELKASLEKSLGPLTFRLTDFEAIPGFEPDEHKGHKMQAKGYLVRQPNAERISLSSMEMLGPVCN
jgi:cytochrome c5